MAALAIVLNRNFSPIDTTSWQNAITALFQGKAVAVSTDYQTYNFQDWAELSRLMNKWPNGFASSENIRLAIPEAIKYLDYDKVPNAGVVFSRRNVFEHYKNTCGYCGKRFPTTKLNLDHIVPQAQGGRGGWDNVCPSCFPCNSHKADRTPEQANMPLQYRISKPKFQSVQSHVVRALSKRMRLDWKHIFEEAYWTLPLEED